MADLRSLFLGDLSVYCTEKDVKEFFQPFGPIEAIKLKRGSSERNHLSYGFIRFVHPESAHAALERLQGEVFLGRPIRLGWAQRNIGKKYQPRDPTENFKTAQIHVSFISKQVDALVSEATLRSLFGMYGAVLDVTIKKSQFDQKLRIQNGYGFVHYPMTFEGIQAAIQSTRNIHQVTVDRVTYDCSLSHSLEQIVLGDAFLSQLWNAPKEFTHNTNPSYAPVPVSSSVGMSSTVLSGADVAKYVGPPSGGPNRRPSDSGMFDRSFSTYTTLPLPPSNESSLHSLNELEASFIREPQRMISPRTTSPRASNNRRPSETFSEISTESLEALANLNLGSSLRSSSRLGASDYSINAPLTSHTSSSGGLQMYDSSLSFEQPQPPTPSTVFTSLEGTKRYF